ALGHRVVWSPRGRGPCRGAPAISPSRPRCMRSHCLTPVLADGGPWLSSRDGSSSQFVSPVLSPAPISVSSSLLVRATMSQKSSLPQPTPTCLMSADGGQARSALPKREDRRRRGVEVARPYSGLQGIGWGIDEGRYNFVNLAFRLFGPRARSYCGRHCWVRG